MNRDQRKFGNDAQKRAEFIVSHATLDGSSRLMEEFYKLKNGQKAADVAVAVVGLLTVVIMELHDTKIERALDVAAISSMVLRAIETEGVRKGMKMASDQVAAENPSGQAS